MVILKTMGQLARANNAVDKGVMKMISGNRVSNAVDKGMSSIAKKGAKSLIRKNEKRSKNLWTGYEVSNKAKIGAGLIATGVIGTSIAHSNYAPYDKSNVTNYGGMPTAMDAEGVGTDTKVSQERFNRQRSNLNADGSLVFGLHNSR